MSPMDKSRLAWLGGAVAGAALVKEHRILGGILGAIVVGAVADKLIERYDPNYDPGYDAIEDVKAMAARMAKAARP